MPNRGSHLVSQIFGLFILKLYLLFFNVYMCLYWKKLKFSIILMSDLYKGFSQILWATVTTQAFPTEVQNNSSGNVTLPELQPQYSLCGRSHNFYRKGKLRCYDIIRLFYINYMSVDKRDIQHWQSHWGLVISML